MPAIPVDGSKTSNKVMELSLGLMELDMKASTRTERNTVKENSTGVTAVTMTEISKITIFMEKAYTFGQMAESMRAHGSTTRWMERVY